MAEAKQIGKQQAEKKEVEVKIPALEIGYFELWIVGDSSLICHRWSEKARKQMLDKQMQQPQQAKKAKNPEEDYKASLYPYPGGGYGFPATAFKNAAVDACSHADGITKVEARGAFHVNLGEDLVKIDGAPSMRPDGDPVRIGMGTADIRYRGEFLQWKTKLTVRHNIRVLSMPQIVNLFNIAGFAIGVGEWRPQKDGSHGMFHAELKGGK